MKYNINEFVIHSSKLVTRLYTLSAYRSAKSFFDFLFSPLSDSSALTKNISQFYPAHTCTCVLVISLMLLSLSSLARVRTHVTHFLWNCFSVSGFLLSSHSAQCLQALRTDLSLLTSFIPSFPTGNLDWALLWPLLALRGNSDSEFSDSSWKWACFEKAEVAERCFGLFMSVGCLLASLHHGSSSACVLPWRHD